MNINANHYQDTNLIKVMMILL